MDKDQTKRLKTELKKLGILLLAGTAYAIWWNATKIGIPCLVHLLLGIKCPGCGMTHAAVAAMHFDFKSAFDYNILSITVVPLFVILLLIQEYRYIKNADRKIPLPETLLLSVMLMVTVGYGIIRNLPDGLLRRIAGIFPLVMRLK